MPKGIRAPYRPRCAERPGQSACRHRERFAMAEVFGARRKQLLRHLLRSESGATVKELVQVLGVTRTAVRQHLAALTRDGLVAPAAILPSGGRPKTLFALTQAGR